MKLKRKKNNSSKKTEKRKRKIQWELGRHSDLPHKAR